MKAVDIKKCVGWRHHLVLSVGLLGLMLGGCSNLWFGGGEDESVEIQPTSTQLLRNSIRGRMLGDAQGQVEVRLPRGWEPSPGNQLHGSAEIRAYNPTDETFLVVVGERKNTVRFTGLQDNAEEYRRLLTSAFDGAAQESRTNTTSINDNPAVQYEIRGDVGGTPIVYLHTTIEANNSYYQVVSWTRADRYNQNQQEMRDIVSSFRGV